MTVEESVQAGWKDRTDTFKQGQNGVHAFVFS
jgi:hypothetical protein